MEIKQAGVSWARVATFVAAFGVATADSVLEDAVPRDMMKFPGDLNYTEYIGKRGDIETHYTVTNGPLAEVAGWPNSVNPLIGIEQTVGGDLSFRYLFDLTTGDCSFRFDSNPNSLGKITEIKPEPDQSSPHDYQIFLDGFVQTARLAGDEVGASYIADVQQQHLKSIAPTLQLDSQSMQLEAGPLFHPFQYVVEAASRFETGAIWTPIAPPLEVEAATGQTNSVTIPGGDLSQQFFRISLKRP